MQHKLSGGGTFTPFYSPDSFGAVSGSFSKVILVMPRCSRISLILLTIAIKISFFQILAFLSIYYE